MKKKDISGDLHAMDEGARKERTENMAWEPHGTHLIAGEWIATPDTFPSEPATGPVHRFSVGTPDLVDQAARAAEEAFWTYGYTSRETRAAFLDRIADEIEARGADITLIGTQETGLPAARLEGERGRTTMQLRLFASHIRKGDYLDRRTDPALPDRQPAPRPEIRLIQRPVGPVAVFGASNFPLAFSTAGGDTAAALAAGCPVVVKGHSAHPGTAEIVAEAIHAAIKALDLPPGTFSLIQGGDRKVGAALVQHPLIKAVGFTGSLAGGRFRNLNNARSNANNNVGFADSVPNKPRAACVVWQRGSARRGLRRNVAPHGPLVAAAARVGCLAKIGLGHLYRTCYTKGRP